MIRPLHSFTLYPSDRPPVFAEFSNKHSSTDLEQPHQRKVRTACFPHQACATDMQVSAASGREFHFLITLGSLADFVFRFQSLIKALNPEEYPYHEELKQGSAAAKRITDKINEAQRRAENEQTAKELESRIEDWKGHHLSHFGHLILDDIFSVNKSGVDREYHVFLFEKIILCCKEAPPQTASKKSSKTNSLLRKPPSAPTLNGGSGFQKKNTQLLLKGRIFLNNVTKAVPAPHRNSTGTAFLYLYNQSQLTFLQAARLSFHTRCL